MRRVGIGVDRSVVAQQRAQFGTLQYGGGVDSEAIHYDTTTHQADTVAVIHIGLPVHTPGSVAPDHKRSRAAPVARSNGRARYGLPGGF